MAPGARNKFCTPKFEPKDLLVVNVLYWRKYLRRCWDFSAPWALCPPCPPSLLPGCYTRHGKIETFASTAHFLALDVHSHCTQYLLSGGVECSNSWIYGCNRVEVSAGEVKLGARQQISVALLHLFAFPHCRFISLTWCPSQKIVHTALSGAPQKCLQSGPALAKAGPGFQHLIRVHISCNIYRKSEKYVQTPCFDESKCKYKDEIDQDTPG